MSGRESWYVLTSFGTLVYYDQELNLFRHSEVGAAPRNTLLVLTDKQVYLTFVPCTDAEIEGESASGRLIFDSVTKPVRRGWFGLQSGRKFLSASPDGNFALADQWLAWEKFEAVTAEQLTERFWTPSTAAGGTELMLAALRQHVGEHLDRINLQLNRFSLSDLDERPLVVWLHNDVNASYYDWLSDAHSISKVQKFVFVSHWQRQRFIDYFRLPLSRCCVIPNAIDVGRPGMQWENGKPWRFRCAYISAPYRGLDILLDAWEELNPRNAELHIWSSLRLWGPGWDDSPYRHLFAKANETKNVVYHGIAPNIRLRAALRDMHFLTYPTTTLETFCIAAVEAMSAGCRVIAPSLAVLPETTAGFAHLYAYTSDLEMHKDAFLDALTYELENPWQGELDLAEAQRKYCKRVYDWDRRSKHWLTLIRSLGVGC